MYWGKNMSHVIFDKTFFKSQKNLLLKIKSEINNNIAEKGLSDLQIEKDQVTEDGDQAQTYQDQNISFGLRDRDLHKLKDIEMALSKIEDGSYGICEETDEPINKKRLEKMPWTRLSIEAAEQLEKERGHKQAAN